jgi:hypothetical protein
MTWTETDLKNLKAKGFKIDDKKAPEGVKSKVKIEKRSIEKDTIHAILDMLKLTNQIEDYVTELQFDETRRFRFDWAIPSLKLAIEYEGVFSKKSRHTTVNGFSEDCVKYNLATCSGWRVLRYTAKNYLNLEKDLIKML